MRTLRVAAAGAAVALAVVVAVGADILRSGASSGSDLTQLRTMQVGSAQSVTTLSSLGGWSEFAPMDVPRRTPGRVEAWLSTQGFDLGRFHREMAAVVAVPMDFAPVAPVQDARPHRVAQTTPPAISASSAVVVDEASAAVLFGKNEDERMAPASLSKVATAILAVQADMDAVVKNTVDSYRMPGSSLMGLRVGDEFTVRDIVYGLMLVSGNDAALSLGRHLAGSDAAFVYQINALFDYLGLRDSHFIDPHGLGGRGHYSTALDMALLSRYGMQFDEFRKVVATQHYVAEGSRDIELTNLNPFLNVYEGADGLKTGFTEPAGPTFIGSAVRDGRRLYVVLLNSNDRFGEASALLDWAFENHDWSSGSDHTVAFIGSDKD